MLNHFQEVSPSLCLRCWQYYTCSVGSVIGGSSTKYRAPAGGGVPSISLPMNLCPNSQVDRQPLKDYNQRDTRLGGGQEAADSSPKASWCCQPRGMVATALPYP